MRKLYIISAGQSPSVEGEYNLYLEVQHASLTPHTVEMVRELVASRCRGTAHWYIRLAQHLSDCPYLGITVPSITMELIMIVKRRREGRVMYLTGGKGRDSGYQAPLVRCMGEEAERGPRTRSLVERGGQGGRCGGSGLLIGLLSYIVYYIVV